MKLGDRVRYIEVAPCLPNRGHGTIIGFMDWGVVVRWDLGMTNVCDIDRLRRV